MAGLKDLPFKTKEVQMKDALGTITGWLNNITDVLKALIALGVAIGILFNDPFNVIAGIGSLMSQFGDAGIAGLIALLLIVSLYNKK